LDELLASNDVSDHQGYYYIQQLDNIHVRLISTKLDDDGKAEQAGIDAVRDGLYSVLSASQRFEDSRKVLVERLEASLSSLRTRFLDRMNAIEQEYDPQRLTGEIESIRDSLTNQLDSFDEEAAKLIAQLEQNQAASETILPFKLDAICMAAREVIGTNELDDVSAHWKSRRHRNWGYLYDLHRGWQTGSFPGSRQY